MEKRRLVLLALVAASVVGCSDGSGPGTDDRFDPARLIADGHELERVIGNGVFASVGAAAAASNEHVPGGTTLIATEAILKGASGSPDEKRDALLAAARAFRATMTPVIAGAPIFPSSVLGTTYVYDAPTGRYAPAPGRPGAPGNGVRFVLYAVNPVTQQPIPSSEIGYADLIDLGAATGSGVKLRLVVSSQVTYLDYTVEMSGNDASGRLVVDGYLSDGDTRVEFDIDVRGTGGLVQNELSVDFELVVPSREFSVTAHVDARDALGHGSGDIELSVRSGGDVVQYEVSGTSTTVDARVYVNGHLFATITGDARAPAVSGANGRQLTPEETEALVYLIHLADAALGAIGTLLAPVGFIAFLSSIP